MEYNRFLEELPALYENWGTFAARPRSERFHNLLGRVRGMTSAGVLQLLNRAVGLLEENEAYCEVGCFQGATLIGALADHPGRVAVAADNFSEFDPHGHNHGALMQNLAAFGLRDQVRFRKQDFVDFLLGLRQEKIRVGVYLYDGAHDYRSQLLGLLMAAPVLAERALIVLDDSNCPAVKQAAWDFMAARPECRLLVDLPTPGNGHPSFWNGVYLLGWDALGNNGYGPDELRQSQQATLLESLDALQLVNLQVQDGAVTMVRKD